MTTEIIFNWQHSATNFVQATLGTTVPYNLCEKFTCVDLTRPCPVIDDTSEYYINGPYGPNTSHYVGVGLSWGSRKVFALLS